jgi:hypothetical protein
MRGGRSDLTGGGQSAAENLTNGGGAQLGGDGGVACLDTGGRERGVASDRLSGRAASNRGAVG